MRHYISGSPTSGCIPLLDLSHLMWLLSLKKIGNSRYIVKYLIYILKHKFKATFAAIQHLAAPNDIFSIIPFLDRQMITKKWKVMAAKCDGSVPYMHQNDISKSMTSGRGGGDLQVYNKISDPPSVLMEITFKFYTATKWLRTWDIMFRNQKPINVPD